MLWTVWISDWIALDLFSMAIRNWRIKLTEKDSLSRFMSATFFL